MVVRVIPVILLIIGVNYNYAQNIESQLESEVNYTAQDSMILSLKKEKAYLYEKAHIDYDSYSLDACFIEFDFKTKNVTARYCLDSNGVKYGIPVLSDGETSTEADSLKFNFETKRGITYHVKLQEGEGYVHGNKVKRQTNGEIHIDTALYTTCDLDHPHYYFKLRKAIIIPDDKIISGPINLYVADIPTPLGLPFAFLPNQKKGSNGIIIPTYGESALGFFLANGGYYHKFKNDQLATAFTGDIYTKGSWALYNNTSYSARYKHSGNMRLTFRKTKTGEKEFDDYSEKTDFLVEWTHSQDPKSIPGMSFRANIKAGTGSVYANDFGNNIVNPSNYLNNTFNSNIAFGKTFKKIPSNLSVNLRHSQNSNTRMISFTLPDVTYSVNRFYPAKWFDGGLVKSNARKQLEKIGITYIINARNETTIADTLLSINHLDRLNDNMRNGLKHTATASASFPFLGNAITFTPSVNANALMYFERTERFYNATSESIDTDTISGFYTPIWATFSAAFTSKIYGFYEFSEFLQGKKQSKVRHVITPSANFSLRPDNGLQYSYVRDSLGNLNYATPFDSQIYGTSPTGSSGRVNFNLINAFEIRQNNLNDSTGDNPYVYKNLLDNLTLSSGYDLMRDSLNWDNLSISGRTNVAKLFNTRFGATFDPYARDSNNIIINQFTKDIEGKLFNMTAANLAFGINLRSKKNKKKVESTKGTEEEVDQVNKEIDQYVQFGEAWNWSLNLGYNFAYNRQFRFDERDTFRLTQTVNISGQMNVTANWNLSFQTNYDITNKKFSYTSVEITRDLHCWEMSFNWVPFGYMKSYNIQINVKSSLLQDLKLQRRRTWYDNGVRG